MRKLTTLTLSLCCSMLLALAACGDKKDDATKSGKPASGGDQAAKADPKPAGPAELSAPDFFKDYQSLHGMEVMDKYGDGVVVHGTVLRKITEMDESVALWLDAGDGNWVSLGFSDNGAAVKAKGIDKGAEVKAKCQVGGADVKYVMNIDCELL